MRIVQLISSRGCYGAENMLLQLTAGLRHRGHEVSIIVFNARQLGGHVLPLRAAAAGLEVLDLPCAGRVNGSAIRALREMLRSRRVEVLHTHNYKSTMYGYLASRGLGLSTVATCHNWTGTTAALRLYASVDRLMLSRFDRVVAVSNSVAMQLARAPLPPRQLSVIGNGVNVPKPRLARDEAEELVIGAVTRLAPEKGVDMLLYAAAEVLGRGVRARFVIAGDGPERERLVRLSRELGISAQVEFLGFVLETGALLQTLDLFVQSSLVDAMPMAVLEAMAAGLPVVASAIGGLPALIGDSQRGLLTRPGDPGALGKSILRLCRSATLRHRLGGAAREYVIQQCSAAAMTLRYEQLYLQARG
jgi:glycosyltransferase involved in cell wall biosynthesis